VISGSQFRHHPAVLLVHCNLAVKSVGQKSTDLVIHRHGGFIAGSLNADYTHKTYQKQLKWGPQPAPARSLCLLQGRPLECAPLSVNAGDTLP
jgi:hypothetical protein